jgi:uncharacterized protein involved in exopolysaccharide biosynthesis
MPDLMTALLRRWKFILGTSLLVALAAWVSTLFAEKEYLSTATALPANSLLTDRARIFNNSIQALYPELGTVDELDRLEGTGKLDTIYIAAANKHNLAGHYDIEQNGEEGYKAAVQLKKNSKVVRTGFGELQVKVWDRDRNLAAALANTLMHSIDTLHQQLQMDNSRTVLQRLRQTYAQLTFGDSAAIATPYNKDADQYRQLIQQYELSLQTAPRALLQVEPARPSLWPDKPKVLITVTLAFLAALVSTYLLSVLLSSKKESV